MTNSFVKLVSDFANWSTICGLPHIVNAQTVVSRAFWAIVFCALFGMFIYELYIMFAKYYSWPAVVTTELLFSEQLFPAVTVCNMNAYKYTVIQNDPKYKEIANVLDQYSKTITNRTSGLTDTYGFLAAKTNFARDEIARDAMAILAKQIGREGMMAAMYSYEDMFNECMFSGKKCTADDFTEFIDPIYGRCWAFNEDAAHNYTITRPGLRYGLKLLITVNQEQPAGADLIPDFLPTTKNGGAKIAINPTNYFPFVYANGLNVGVGHQTAISMTFHSTNRAKRPYGKCVDTEAEATNYYKNWEYSMETCFEGCKQRECVAKCGCSNPRYRAAEGATWCGLDKLDCLQSLKGDQRSTTDPNLDPLKDCGCDPPCKETSYATTASLATFPTMAYFVATSVLNGNNTNAKATGSCDGISGAFNIYSDAYTTIPTGPTTTKVTTTDDDSEEDDGYNGGGWKPPGWTKSTTVPTTTTTINTGTTTTGVGLGIPGTGTGTSTGITTTTKPTPTTTKPKTTTTLLPDAVILQGMSNKCREWYQTNALLLQVFFETLKYEVYTEEAAYPFSSLLNDLGGHAGLWLGMSIISCFELCGFFIMLCVYCCCRREKTVNPNGQPDEKPKDKEYLDSDEEFDSPRKDTKVNLDDQLVAKVHASKQPNLAPLGNP